MNSQISRTEVDAIVALNELNKRQKLLNQARGRGGWRYFISIISLLLVGVMVGKNNVQLLYLLTPVIILVSCAYELLSRRLNALIELLELDVQFVANKQSKDA